MTYDFRSQRLFLDQELTAGSTVDLARSQSHYLLNVLRMRVGDTLLVFNGSDGEWRARIADTGRKACRLAIIDQTRPQPETPNLHYLFAPLKQARLDYMVQKAVEMGAGRLSPVLTEFTQVTRINQDRLRANAIEAAEQCGILSIPAIDAPARLDAVIGAWPADKALVFCDERAARVDARTALAALQGRPAAVLIGPEGGFSDREREKLVGLPFVTAISLGPRILRADTAAVAALALVQSTIGDWTVAQ